LGRFVKGDVVVVPFPFADLTDSKRRPALVIASLIGNDIHLCQITSHTINDNYSIVLTNEDFKEGSLKQKSNIRPNRIFTADEDIILYKIGSINQEKTLSVTQKIIDILTS
jgi:mRNA interferase MazF